ncbi:MAG: LytTR family DNA-binding domain-containing protein [Lysobacterales bacterium]
MLPMFRPTEDYLTHYFDIARYQWIFAFSIGIFTTLFLVAFQPFGVNNFDPNFHISLDFLLITSAFGLLVTASVAVNEFLLRPLLLKNLTRRRLTGWLIWTWLLLSTVVFLFYNYLGDWHDFKWPSYLGFIRDIGLLLSIPVAGFIFYIRHESLKSEFVQLQSIHLQTPASRLVHLSSDNQKDQVSVALDDLVLLESQDNYVAVVYMDGETRRASLIRSSLKRLEESLDVPLLVRCHRSFMVNLARVRAYQGNRHGLKLSVVGAERSVPVSRAYTGTILKKLGTSVGDV